MRVERQRPRYPASQRLVHYEIERKKLGQLVTNNVAFDNAREMRFHTRRRHLSQQQRIMLRIIGDDGDIGDVALVAGTRMSDLTQLHGCRSPKNCTCGFANSRGNSTEATATTSRADLKA